jgi:general secretion pathway protein A
MYLEHFRFVREPFSIAPDPGFLYLSEGHNEALAHLQYGLNHGGFVLITGEVGTGKTTLLRNLVRMTPDNMDLAFILNPRLTAKELLETICEELAVAHDKITTQSIKQYIDLLNQYLLRAHREGRSTVLVIDEAQNLSPAVLEQIRLLTNLETDERKLLRIILIGQPELDALLARTELRQLSQRITARYRLGPLGSAETSAYVAHRLATAGGNPRIFTQSALRKLHRVTGGIPRLINVVADRALLGAYGLGVFEVTQRIVERAAIEVIPDRQNGSWLAITAMSVLVVITLALIAFWVTERRNTIAEPMARSGPSVVVPAEDVKPSETPLSPETADSLVENNGTDLQDGSVAATTTRTRLVNRPAKSNEELLGSAYRQLFSAWTLEYDATANGLPCEFANLNGLSCTSQTGTLADIEQLDLPVVIELWDEKTEPYHAALLGLEGTRLTLGLDGAIVNATPQDLREQWFGNFTYVWPRPPLYRGLLSEGDLQDSVVVLRDRLQTALGRPIPSTIQNLFDAELARALLEFQKREALVPDRVVGPQTWLRLARVTDSNSIPSLHELTPMGAR